MTGGVDFSYIVKALNDNNVGVGWNVIPDPPPEYQGAEQLPLVRTVAFPSSSDLGMKVNTMVVRANAAAAADAVPAVAAADEAVAEAVADAAVVVEEAPKKEGEAAEVPAAVEAVTDAPVEAAAEGDVAADAEAAPVAEAEAKKDEGAAPPAEAAPVAEAPPAEAPPTEIAVRGEGPEGVYVTVDTVVPGKCAESLTIRGGDAIFTVAGRAVSTFEDLAAALVGSGTGPLLVGLCRHLRLPNGMRSDPREVG